MAEGRGNNYTTNGGGGGRGRGRVCCIKSRTRRVSLGTGVCVNGTLSSVIVC